MRPRSIAQAGLCTLLTLAALVLSREALAVTRQEAVDRAQLWVDAQLPYCQCPNHGYDAHGQCNRVDNPDWDPYRTDCSGLVSWAWALPAPGRVTWTLWDVATVIDAGDLKPGDAINSNDHVMLFAGWTVYPTVANLIDEHNWGTDARRMDFNVSIGGSTITRDDWPANPFTAIRYNSIQESCAAHCEGASIVGADCGVGDCSVYGATCADDALGVRCVSVFCPALGTAAVCLPNSQLVGNCVDGAITTVDCAASGQLCSSVGGGHCESPAPPPPPAHSTPQIDVSTPDSMSSSSGSNATPPPSTPAAEPAKADSTDGGVEGFVSCSMGNAKGSSSAIWLVFALGVALAWRRRAAAAAGAGALALAATACGDATSPTEKEDEKVAVAYEGVTVCAGGPTVPGIDVSDWQGDIDWAAAAGSGLTFAISRISDGTHLDGHFQKNWAESKANGLIRGAYQFYEPTTDPIVQADIVVNAVGQLGAGDLPVTLDVEWTTGTPNAQAIQAWVDRVTDGTGKRPMIYTAVGYWNQYFNGELGNVDLWVANWGVNCPALPSSWTSWVFWQPGGGGTPGIAGNVDQDVFNGSLQDLQMLANADLTQNCRGSMGGACAHFGCHCVDDSCNGGFCGGTGCTQKHTAECGNFGCNCVDGQCGGAFCGGDGCTAKEQIDCKNFGCGCVDHQCQGGACQGTGCTAKETIDCQNQGLNCALEQCEQPPQGSSSSSSSSSSTSSTSSGDPMTSSSSSTSTSGGMQTSSSSTSSTSSTSGMGGAPGASSSTGIQNFGGGDDSLPSDNGVTGSCSVSSKSESPRESGALWLGLGALAIAFARRSNRKY
jgi:MYXO-CTERM domain-containing protein